MSNSNDNSSSPQNIGARRQSFTQQALAQLFGSNNNNNTNNAGNTGTSPGSVASAAAEAQRRRTSISGMGLSTAYGANSLGGFKRTGSVSSHASGAIDESAVEDGEPLSAQGSPSNNSFGRRMSFGARALRDVRMGSSPGGSGTNGRSPNTSNVAASSSDAANDAGKKTTTSPGSVKGRDPPGYNWADNVRNRAERSASMASQNPGSGIAASHERSKSVATMQPPPVAQPQPQQQQQPAPMHRPLDHMQERILKGDFYMD